MFLDNCSDIILRVTRLAGKGTPEPSKIFNFGGGATLKKIGFSGFF